MLAVNLISNALSEEEREPLPCVPKENICAVTGLLGPCVPRSELFGKSFTNLDLLKRPDSKFVGTPAFYALKYKWERMSSWFCDGVKFKRLDRLGVREMVFSKDLSPQWAGYATTSYKKHGALNAQVNTGKNRVWLFETRQVDLTNQSQVEEYWTVLNQALLDGFGRSILESLNCPTFVLNKVGIKKWIAFESWAKDKFLSPLYAFMVYLLPSQEELGNAKKK